MKQSISKVAIFILVWASFLAAPRLQASEFKFLLGPPSLGQGGSNPLSIPPINPVDWQLVFVTNKDREWLLSLVPGLLYGQRFRLDGFYASLGAGILVTTSGLGLGLGHAYGYESKIFASHYRFIIEYRQVLGLAEYGWQFPYTFRMGISYAL